MNSLTESTSVSTDNPNQAQQRSSPWGRNPLAAGLLNLLLVISNSPRKWPVWAVVIGAFLPVAVMASLWLLLVGAGWLYLGTALCVFVMFDVVVLTILPGQGMSFGPVGPRLLRSGSWLV